VLGVLHAADVNVAHINVSRAVSSQVQGEMPLALTFMALDDDVVSILT
jgi:hypothetical protein